MKRLRRALLAVLCAGALFGGAAPVQAAPPEPDFVLTPDGLEGPCGIAVDSTGVGAYFSNYYPNRVEILWRPQPYGPPTTFTTALAAVVPLDGPCGLALDALGSIYVNNYHRNVERYATSPDGLNPPIVSGPPTVIDSSHPTGVAVDDQGGRVYVNARTYIAVYDAATGAPVMDGGDPLRVGEGSLGDGYGLAVSGHPGTEGFLYVADRTDNVVEVYDPAADVEDPVAVIDAHETPTGGFGSLRDSAIAVDNLSGDVYVADTRAYPQYTDRPEATVQVFSLAGAYKGRLKYNVIDGSPVGMAVDNSSNFTQGRVYVTSGNTVGAGIYAYPPGSATGQSAPPSVGLSRSDIDISRDLPASPAPEKGAASAQSDAALPSAIAQKGTLRVTVKGKLAPKRLPRKGTAPISVSVEGRISTTDKTMPPQLKTIQVELNRGGKLDTKGLPPCNYSRIQPGSSDRALSACRDSLVGKGSFRAEIILAGQQPYPTGGEMLLFHSVEKGKPVLYGHIYSAKPFATSFVIVFKVQKIVKGRYGIALNAPMPPAMDAWGRLTGLQMTLSRRYIHKGKAHSFLSAGCPTPKGFTAASFPLARTEFSFEGGKKLRSTLISQCRVRR